jgi:hypothetical protein
MRTVSHQSCRENRNTYFMFKNFSLKIVPFMRYMEECCRARQATDNTIRRMRFACRISKTTDTHSEYVIRIAFPRQQWLRERASMLRLYVHRLSCYFFLSFLSFRLFLHFVAPYLYSFLQFFFLPYSISSFIYSVSTAFISTVRMTRY